MAVVEIYTAAPCNSITLKVEYDEWQRRWRVARCGCGWEVFTLVGEDEQVAIAINGRETREHKRVAATNGWDSPRRRMIAWVR